MENFIAYNPTKLIFGKDACKGLGKAVAGYGKNVLLVYGKGSVKANGIYDIVLRECKSAGLNVTEYSGIRPNPVSQDVNKAVELAILKKSDVVLAVGGGSVIDSAKIIALCIPGKNEAWNVMKGKEKPSSALPVIAVLTLAATGTEMNPYAVLQNHETKEKTGFGNPNIFPKISFLDPCFTFSVSKEYTAYGIADIIAHSLEAWFGHGESSMADRIIVSVIKEVMENTRAVLNDLRDYESRANILLASTLALNGSTVYGKSVQDWGVHDIGHTLSLLYDIPHGASLSIAYPAWLKHQQNNLSERIITLGRDLFGLNKADETIAGLENFFISAGCPVRLTEAGIDVDKSGEIIDLMKRNKVSGFVHKLSGSDYGKIVAFMY